MPTGPLLGVKLVMLGGVPEDEVVTVKAALEKPQPPAFFNAS